MGCSGRGHPHGRIRAVNSKHKQRLIKIQNGSDVTNYPVLCQELGGERPRRISHHFVHIATVLHSVIPLIFIHYREALEVMG